MTKFRKVRFSDVVQVTDYVANGSFESLRNNVTASSSPGYAILVRLVDHNGGWSGPYRYVDKASYEFLTKSRLDYGDVIIANVGANAGTVFRVPELPLPITLGPNAVLCRPRDPNVLNRDFLYYYLLGPEGQSLISGIISGSAQPKFNKTGLRQLPLILPTNVQQQAIAEILGAIDDKIVSNTNISHSADQLAGHLFDQAASSVPTIPMSEVLTPVLGGTPARANLDYWDGERLWASAKDITGAPFAVVVETDEKITQHAVEHTKAKPLPAGSVVLTARGTVGAVARLAVPSSFNQSCYGFSPSVLPPGLLYFSVLRAAEHAKSLAHGSVFDTITMRTFDRLQIPDFGDTGASTEAQIAPLLDLVSANILENRLLTKTRDTLLPQLMSGKLCVKNAESLVESVL